MWMKTNLPVANIGSIMNTRAASENFAGNLYKKIEELSKATA